MTGDDFGSLLYLVLLLLFLGGWTIARGRRSRRQVWRHAGSWVLIFGVAILGAGLWDDIRQSVPRQALIAADGPVEVPRSRDGHYYLTLQVDGTPVRFLVDTGATEMVLSRRDAERIGVDEDRLIFSGRAGTANGFVATAPVWLDDVSLGSISDTDVPAHINGGDMDVSLLGMSYLRRFERIEMTADRLVLHR